MLNKHKMLGILTNNNSSHVHATIASLLSPSSEFQLPSQGNGNHMSEYTSRSFSNGSATNTTKVAALYMSAQ